MDTILGVVFVIFAIVLYVGILSIPLLFLLLFLYIVLRIVIAVCYGIAHLLEKLGGEPTYEEMIRMYNQGLREPLFLQKLEAKRVELQGTDFRSNACNMQGR